MMVLLLLFLSLMVDQVIPKVAPERDDLKHQRQLWSAKCAYDDARKAFRDHLLLVRFTALHHGRWLVYKSPG